MGHDAATKPHPPLIHGLIGRSLRERGSGLFPPVQRGLCRRARERIRHCFQAPALLIACLTLTTLPWGPLFADVTGRARVIDGDTIEVAGETVRLRGIDAPELDQTCRRAGREFPCGAEATRWLVERTHDRELTCAEQGSDRYDRLLAVCRVGDMVLNAEMVRAGWAVASLRYTRIYIEEEMQAAKTHAGMWAGEFSRPGDWRRGEPRLATAARPPDRCVVKGNVNSRGERIYHPPGGPSYERVKVRPWEGDRCFESAQEARQAGFRAAAR